MKMIATFISPVKESRVVSATGSRIVIGRDESAEINLDHPSVSRTHARVTLIEGKSHFFLEDCRSANGTFLEGVPVKSSTTLYPDQNLEIGPFRFHLCVTPDLSSFPAGPHQVSHDRSPEEDSIVQEAVRSLPALMEAARHNHNGEGGEELSVKAEKILYQKIIHLLGSHTGTGNAEILTRKALTLSLGLGPLEEWLEDPGVSEIMINGTDSAYLEKKGQILRVKTPFGDSNLIMGIIDRILAPLGRRVDEKNPYVDGRLPDGSRINVVIPPASLIGPVVTIRKFPARQPRIDDLVANGTVSADAASFLKQAVRKKRNIIISGGTGAGKTTLLNVLASFIQDLERVVTIEDAAELKLNQEHVVRLETRPANLEGTGEITTRDLVRNSLRMRPDRIIVGECRGGEAFDMLQAMNTGHEGSMTTCHANSPRDALKRIEMMALMGGLAVPQHVIREQIASAVNIIVQIVRLPGGRRAVTHIVEVDGYESEQVLTQPIFEPDGDEGGAAATGIQASFLSGSDIMEKVHSPSMEVRSNALT
ncbi:MAG: ATPase, T2SS/T4P/T4SS family [bacterium]|nr:ATPase, T2SS/T4P/T4SS family [bacterium]